MRTYFVPEPLGSCEKRTEMKRKKVLLLTEKEWQDLNDRRDYEQKEQEAADKIRRDKQRLKDESRSMVKHWRNTMEDTRAVKLKMRQERLDKEKKARDLKFLEIQKEKAEERRIYIEQCKKLMLYEKDNTKTLNSALRFAEVLREREAQIKFEKKLQDIEIKREAEYAAKIKKDAEEFQQQKMDKQRKAEEKKIKMKKMFFKHMKKQEKYPRLEKEQKLKERKEMEGLKKEMEMLDKQAKDREIAKKAHFREAVFLSLKESKELQERMKEREELDEQTAAVFAEVKRKIANIRKEKVKQKRAKELEVKEKLAAKIMKATDEREQQEEALIRKAVAERDEKERQLQENKAAYQKRLKEESIECHHKYLEDEEKRKQREKEVLKWEILQRFKKVEDDNRIKREEEEKYRKLQRYMKRYYDKQVLEREARTKKEIEEDINAAQDVKDRWNAQDQEFLKYAEEMIEESKKLNRPIEPMVKVVEEYKKIVGLTKVHRSNEKMRSRIPFGPKNIEEPVDICGPCKCDDSKK